MITWDRLEREGSVTYPCAAPDVPGDEIVGFRDQWQAQLADGGYVDGHFGIPVGDTLPPIPAPPLPNARLKARGITG